MAQILVSTKLPLILTQIAGRLHDIFDGHIDLADVAKKSKTEREQSLFD